MSHKRKATMMASSKTWNHHIREIIYILYEDNISQNKKLINFFSNTSSSFINETAKFGHCMDLIDAVVNPDQISNSKK